MHKPAQVELQLDWSQLPYLAYSGPLPQKAAQPNAQYTKKGPFTSQNAIPIICDCWLEEIAHSKTILNPETELSNNRVP